MDAARVIILNVATNLKKLDDNIKFYYNDNFGYPKYKSKYDRNSYSTNAIYSTYKDRKYCNIELDLINRKYKKRIKRLQRELARKVKRSNNYVKIK